MSRYVLLYSYASVFSDPILDVKCSMIKGT